MKRISSTIVRKHHWFTSYTENKPTICMAATFLAAAGRKIPA